MEVKKMRNQKGKVNISSILIITVLIYGAFAGFKVISSRVTKTQIKSEIIEKFGFIRGTDFTSGLGEEIIRKILIEHNLYSEDVGEGEENEYESGDENVNAASYGTKIVVNVQGAKITFSVEYTDVIDFIFFKSKARYLIEEEMLNYN
jgi:hypothetical protein